MQRLFATCSIRLLPFVGQVHWRAPSTSTSASPVMLTSILDVLFNCLDEALKSSPVKDLKSLVPDYFKSEYVFTQTCGACGAVHSTENCESTLVRLSALHRTLEDAILAYFDYKTGVQLTCGHCSHQLCSFPSGERCIELRAIRRAQAGRLRPRAARAPPRRASPRAHTAVRQVRVPAPGSCLPGDVDV